MTITFLPSLHSTDQPNLKYKKEERSNNHVIICLKKVVTDVTTFSSADEFSVGHQCYRNKSCPNIYAMLFKLLTLPVGSNSCERSQELKPTEKVRSLKSMA